MKSILLCFILSLGFSNMVFSQACDEVPKSRYSDISFEGLAQFNMDELIALYNFLENPPPELESALSDFIFLFSSSMIEAKQQNSYILENGLDCSCLRLCPEEIAGLNPKEQNAYWTHITYMEENFALAADELESLTSHLQNLQEYSSAELAVSEQNLIQYLGLANMLNYTKFEMFRDMTGFCSVSDYLSIIGEGVNFPMEFHRGDKQGLGARASIKRLQKIVQCNSSDFRSGLSATPRNTSNILNGLSVDVNNDPFSKNINLIVSNNNNKLKTFSASILDMGGNTINTITDEAVIEGDKQMTYQVSSADLSTGLYFVTVISGNKATSKKVMIFNN